MPINSPRSAVILFACVLLSACAKEPFGEVAEVIQKSGNSNAGAATIRVKDDMRALASRYGYTIYGRVSVHSLGTKKPDCSDVHEKRTSEKDVSNSKKQQLYEAGWVPINDTVQISYRREDDALFVRIAGSAKETRCILQTSGDQLRAHVHFLGEPMPLGSSDEGMLGLDVVVPN